MKARLFGGPLNGRELEVRDDAYNLVADAGRGSVREMVSYARVSSIPRLPYAVFVFPFAERVLFSRHVLDNAMIERAAADLFDYAQARTTAALRLMAHRAGLVVRGEPVFEQVPGDVVPNSTIVVGFAFADRQTT